MRSLSCALAVLACPLSGQGPTADFAIYPDSTSATSRSGIHETDSGDVLLQVHRDVFRGVGTTHSPAGQSEGRVLGFSAVVQSSALAPQQFNFALYGDDLTWPGQPRIPPLLRTANLLTPAGPGAWLVTIALTTPAAVIPRDETWYFGVGLFPAPAVLGGGLSVHMATYRPLGPPFGTGGDNPRLGAPNLTWVVQPVGALAQPYPARTHFLQLHTDGAVLNNGADVAPALRLGPNPCFGVAGIYPDNGGRGDGLAFRVRDSLVAGGPVAVVAAPAFGPPTTASFLAGFLLIDPAALLPLTGGTMPASGELVLQPPFLAQGQLPAGIRGTVAFQAFTVGGGLVRASNATVTSFQ